MPQAARRIVAAAARHHRALRHAPGLGHRGREPAGRVGALVELRHLVARACPVAASSSSDHARFATSSQKVPAESDMSEAYSPVMPQRAHSPWAAEPSPPSRKRCGSCFFTQTSLGAVKPASGMLPVISRALGSRASISLHSAKERASFHRMPGAAPCPPCRAAWRHAAGRKGRCPRRRPSPWALALASALTTALAAFHQSSGFCSDQPGCGRDTLSGDAGGGDDLLPAVDQHALDRRGSDIETEIHEPALLDDAHQRVSPRYCQFATGVNAGTDRCRLSLARSSPSSGRSKPQGR